ncbi:MAG: type II toxin-antitoxin system ParD family antitoxin [Sphingomonadales bacterium]
MATMNVSLPGPMKDWIDERVKSGRYGNASEYVRDLIREDQRNEEWRQYVIRELEEGEADLREGRYTVLNSREEQTRFFNEIVENAIHEAAQAVAAGKKASG